MTTEKLAAIRDEAAKAYPAQYEIIYMNADTPRLSGVEYLVHGFKAGWNAALETLAGISGEFDEKAAEELLIDFVNEQFPADQCPADVRQTIFDLAFDTARWQHSQDAAQIGLLKAELDECKANESYATGMLQRREITNLKTQLKIELDSHESTLNMLQLLNAELASLRERVLVYETALKFYADADNFELGSACEHCQDEALILEYWKEKSGQREIGNVANEALSRGGKL